VGLAAGAEALAREVGLMVVKPRAQSLKPEKREAALLGQVTAWLQQNLR